MTEKSSMINFMNRLQPKDQALFNGLKDNEIKGVYEYLFSIPRSPNGIPRLRSHVIGLYDPFCDRRYHPIGVLWQSAPYSYCDHRCVYCYGRSYLRRFKGGAVVKKDFCRSFEQCLLKMKNLGVPPRHLSMANSTDVLQENLERHHRHTLFMLDRLREYPGLFSSICVLTRNPGILLDDLRYIEALKDLSVEVQVSITFFRDAVVKYLEPGAPTISERRTAVEGLIKQGIHVTLRLDPLFPRGVNGCKEYQSLNEDLIPLIQWASAAGINNIITSPLKLVYRRNTIEAFNRSIISAFPEVRGNYRRMNQDLQASLISELRIQCEQAGLSLQHCFHNIIKRNPSTA